LSGTQFAGEEGRLRREPACLLQDNPCGAGAGENAVDAAKLLVELQLLLVAMLESSQVEKPLPSEALETGPPFVVSFAETVLQRSLLSRAPPLAV
jgi:hypothetical protein